MMISSTTIWNESFTNVLRSKSQKHWMLRKVITNVSLFPIVSILLITCPQPKNALTTFSQLTFSHSFVHLMFLSCWNWEGKWFWGKEQHQIKQWDAEVGMIHPSRDIWIEAADGTTGGDSDPQSKAYYQARKITPRYLDNCIMDFPVCKTIDNSGVFSFFWEQQHTYIVLNV